MLHTDFLTEILKSFSLSIFIQIFLFGIYKIIQLIKNVSNEI